MHSRHHLRYLAEQLASRPGGSSVDRLGTALHDAQVDLNPHQVDAALFAFQSPLQDGVILADEVGLGKTIEAGLVILQRWSENTRRILVICPASLRKQWGQELREKFFLPSQIFDGPSWNTAIRGEQRNPFEQPEIVICSYQFAAARAEALGEILWDLVVIDEAHRVRNVYKTDNKIGRALRGALRGRKKLLLTATPLQNSLMELYGLVSFIDEYAFGDERSFRLQYSRLTDSGSFDQLRRRLQPYCHRTLRRQVTEYISYTQRIPITQDFIPGNDEQQLYELVSAYLQREKLHGLPSGQRSLMTLVLRKLLASSTFAIAGALDSLLRRLHLRLKDDTHAKQVNLDTELGEDYEDLTETAEEWEESSTLLSATDREALEAEILELTDLRDRAIGITENAKGQALVEVLQVGFAKTKELGAEDKVLIFTESRRTQNYLHRLLNDHGYDDIVLFNGSNTDPGTREIYREWQQVHQGSDRISGSRTADTRAALVDAFRYKARIMIATEAAAEGINLQFCSLIVNYDLPWNPQRIEQRIGRCHRYGQKHDVIVINFLNRNNAADQRVFQLLAEKFQLFSGVFGASDEILGAVESGVDFQHRIVDIYQNARNAGEIKQQFDQLQLELETHIDAAMQQTRQQLLEHFDADVHDRLRINLAESKHYLGKLEQNLWQLTRGVLADHARFDDSQNSFRLENCPPGLATSNTQTLLGTYRMTRFPESGHKYRLQHPLAQWVIDRGKALETPDASLVIDYSSHRAAGGARRSRIEALTAQCGWLQLERLDIDSAGGHERHLLLAAVDDHGQALDEETTADLLRVAGEINTGSTGPAPEQLQAAVDRCADSVLSAVSERNQQYFLDAIEKLDNRAADLKNGLEQSLKELDRDIRATKQQARSIADLEGKIELHQKINGLEKRRNQQRRDLYAAQDQIDEDKERLIDDVQSRLKQQTERESIYRLRWHIQTQ
ncbi:helicase domain-containing protein [Salinisphaera dokdonensis CL-ES53]|uniref:Helicase domain-containing protein n=1 Tax=Salinisphaera dokdonensis CL-ES53 TaxID=1304272 RepID=A0ABV2AYZ1_9GAMM